MWFRRDLTLDDNVAWCDATTGCQEVIALFVLDARVLARAGPPRRRQFVDALAGLDDELRSCGGSLSIIAGDARAVVARVAREHDVDVVHWNDDVTRFARARDDAVAAELARSGIALRRHWSTFVHPPTSILTAAGTVPRVFARFHDRWSGLAVADPVESGPARLVSIPGEPVPRVEGAPTFPGGPCGADDRLHALLERVDRYDDSRDLVAEDATSHLSADLHFGSISPRAALRAVGFTSAGRRAFVRQLAWRDWFGHLFAERPDLVDHAQAEMFDHIAWRDDPAAVEAWMRGRTGYPIVDAAMRELAASGWIPNRLRMVAASFLVKDLLVDWRVGERHFRRLLVDGDVSQNAGNWQWVAGTGPDAAPYFRVFNPVTQARRFDPVGEYTRARVPELAGLPGASIHAPWELGPLELAAAGVFLGDTYPSPIVEHATARLRAIAAYVDAREARPR